MKILRGFDQGSREWLRARCGKITASAVGNVVTPAQLKPSKGTAYLDALVVERILGVPADDTQFGWGERGHEWEPKAREWYGFTHDVDIEEVGFIASDCGRFGASPDGVIAEVCGLEIKCPGAKTHVGWLRDEAEFDKYVRLQVQFGMWVTGWERWVAVGFNPSTRIPNVVREYEPDAKVHAAFEEHVPVFADRVDAVVKKIEDMRVRDFGDPDDPIAVAAAIVFG